MHYLFSENKGVISFVATAKLICAFVFAYANCWFSHKAAHMELIIITLQQHTSSSEMLKKTESNLSRSLMAPILGGRSYRPWGHRVGPIISLPSIRFSQNSCNMRQILFDPRHEKTRYFAYVKTKPQISCAVILILSFWPVSVKV